MLAEFTNRDRREIWLNPAHVIRVSGSELGANVALIDTVEGQEWVCGTPAEVAAKLNGAEVEK